MVELFKSRYVHVIHTAQLTSKIAPLRVSLLPRAALRVRSRLSLSKLSGVSLFNILERERGRKGGKVRGSEGGREGGRKRDQCSQTCTKSA